MRQFNRGERAKLSDLAAIHHLWEVGVSIDAPYFIVDFCCLGLNEKGLVVDDRYLISYNQPDAPQGAIRLDNSSNNGAIFSLKLERLPTEIRRLVFTATLHAPELPGGLFGAALSLFGVNDDIGEGHLTLSTPAIDTGVFTFSGQDFGAETTLILGEFYWREEWRFVAAGQPLKGELHAFLQTLTEGPMPAPMAVPTPTQPPRQQPRSPVLAAPPRPPRVPTAPAKSPFTPAPNGPPLRVTPTAPLPVPFSPPAVAPPLAQPTLAQPPESFQAVASSLTSRPAAIPAPVPAVKEQPVVSPSLPQRLPPGGKLQDLIDATAPGSTLTLLSGEYEGPVRMSQALILEGRGSAIWSRSGPVVIIDAPDVVLRNLDIEVTISQGAPDETGVALQVENQVPPLHLDNVRLRGRIRGVGDADGHWVLPAQLALGAFAPRADNEFHFTLRVPTAVQLSSPVEGVSLSPPHVDAGEHQVVLQVRDVPAETLLVGFVEVRSTFLVRTIALSGSADMGSPPKRAINL